MSYTKYLVSLLVAGAVAAGIGVSHRQPEIEAPVNETSVLQYEHFDGNEVVTDIFYRANGKSNLVLRSIGNRQRFVPSREESETRAVFDLDDGFTLEAILGDSEVYTFRKYR